MPILAQSKLESGDVLTIIGLKHEVETAAKVIGSADRPTTSSNLILVGLGIFIGCIIGVLSIKIGNVPVSLSTSGGALLRAAQAEEIRLRAPHLPHGGGQRAGIAAGLYGTGGRVGAGFCR